MEVVRAKVGEIYTPLDRCLLEVKEVYPTGAVLVLDQKGVRHYMTQEEFHSNYFKQV